MTATTPQLLTAEEFWQRYEGKPYELVRGEVREQMPTGGLHGTVASRIHLHLALWAQSGGGEVGFEVGFRVRRLPDAVRAPDIFYVSAQQVPAEGVPVKFWNQAPDLAVEVVSPSETAQDVREKILDYLEGGTQFVWVVYSSARRVDIYAQDDTVRVLKMGDTLEHEILLPGFRLPLEELFR